RSSRCQSRNYPSLARIGCIFIKHSIKIHLKIIQWIVCGWRCPIQSDCGIVKSRYVQIGYCAYENNPNFLKVSQSNYIYVVGCHPKYTICLIFESINPLSQSTRVCAFSRVIEASDHSAEETLFTKTSTFPTVKSIFISSPSVIPDTESCETNEPFLIEKSPL